MLLWTLNVLQENTGATGVFPSDADRQTFLGTIRLIGRSSRRERLKRSSLVSKVLQRMLGTRRISTGMCASA
jgi:hypothetical protein